MLRQYLKSPLRLILAREDTSSSASRILVIMGFLKYPVSSVLILLFCFSPFLKGINCLKLAQPGGQVIPDVCQNTFACAQSDPSNWPSSSFRCGATGPDVSATSFSSARISIFTGMGRKVSKNEWPSSCKLAPNATPLGYSNGKWTAYYSMATTCECASGNPPDCSFFSQKSNSACNVAMLSFCQLRQDGSACSPVT
ncbi:hypothetical protein O181_022797 [Austropuccinia psidii MF-1]|uniref:Uncharacterized protein n=1 Tax=Austropuccinia psidii MF-1 TaxID=1389203 RepID=A0A9Q3CG86_9BASI|nr:hypothetical protein [Austropuccinia psidii MF-1]